MTVDAFYTSEIGIRDIDYRGNSRWRRRRRSILALKRQLGRLSPVASLRALKTSSPSKLSTTHSSKLARHCSIRVLPT
jgi:hypothetical protein